MKRILLGSILLSISLSPIASATTLGKLTVTSAIGQPLQASIPVSGSVQPSQHQITVSLAPIKINDTIAKQQQTVLDNLNFAVIKQGNDAVTINISSQKPVNEPVLRLPIKVSWQTGELLREYTVFMDPPKPGQHTPAAQRVTSALTQQPPV